MKTIEKSAKTYEEALQAALADLGATISEVNVETLEEGSKGLFGLFGSRPYKIRVTKKEEEKTDDLDLDALLHGDRKKAEPAPAPRRERAEKPAPVKEAPAAEAAPVVEKPAEPRPVKPRAPRAEKPAPVQEVKPVEAAAEPEEPAEAAPEAEEDAPAGEEQAAPARRRRRRSHKPKQPNAEKAEKAEQPEEEKKPLPPKAPARPLEKPVVTMLAPEEITEDSAAGKAKSFLNELTHMMGVEVEIAVGTDPEGNIFVQMTGDTLGVLIGRRGETLDALQYLTSLKVNRGQEGYTRVTLDTENYRAKREDTLIRLANRMANKAVKTGRRVSLEPMNPYERRIIHSALQANEAVDTHSEDEEPNRHVVITLRK